LPEDFARRLSHIAWPAREPPDPSAPAGLRCGRATLQRERHAQSRCEKIPPSHANTLVPSGISLSQVLPEGASSEAGPYSSRRWATSS
jgi:hypothetical protein